MIDPITSAEQNNLAIEFPEIHYHVMLIIPYDEKEADKVGRLGLRPLMFIPEDKIIRGLFAYEKAYALTTPSHTLVACYRKEC